MRKAMAEPSEQGLKPGAEQRRQTADQSKAEKPEQPAEVVCHQEAGEPGIGPNPLLVHGSLDIDRREDGSTDPEDQQAGGCQGGGQAASDEFPAAAGAGSLDGRGREGGIVQQQGVGGYAEEPAQPHHMLGIGSGGARFP